MQTKHTTAPWERSNDNKTVFAYSEKEPVAWVSGYSNDAEQEANAKLIAAAPALLDALTEALDQLESWNQESEDTFTMKRVREAIDKAIN